jgi:hypothetical protein
VVIRVALERKVAGWTPGISPSFTRRSGLESIPDTSVHVIWRAASHAVSLSRGPEASITQAKPIGGKRFTLTLRIAAQQRGDVGKHTALLISE